MSVQREANMDLDDIPSGNIQFDDPMIAEQASILLKNTVYYGFKGLLNFGRARKPQNKFVKQSIYRINRFENKYVSSVWVSWSFILIPCTAVSYFLWNAPKYDSFNSAKESLMLFIDKSLSNMNTSSFPIHAYYSKFIQSNLCINYLNINNLSTITTE